MIDKQVKKQNVLIKGTKDGLTFILNDQCTFEMLIEELEEKLSERSNMAEQGNGSVRVKLVTGNRYLNQSHIQELETILIEHIQAEIDTIESDVITKEEAERLRKNLEVTRLVKVVRSGQVFQVEGDLLLLGDVNPGGTIKATGNIFVMGALRGAAHAGVNGNKQAVICAASMSPTQLKIADILRRSPEKEEEEKEQAMECAFVSEEENEMQLDKVQRLIQLRPNISSILEEQL
ncbi:septum site-determining protein MinC [Bacillus shivajii]|uniref:septum site-determining protein MinC n=1 Tax=Bacillus shivajii TaxID=1983719 RepID=UPI001CF9CF8C|nr:septum site-determining protein MinC [Bacillus shivajii]UCZ52086.1 septum site-determining protein MinC [Bacillus shivajii]